MRCDVTTLASWRVTHVGADVRDLPAARAWIGTRGWELERQFDGDIDGADRFDNYIEGVVADALGDGGMDVGAGAHSGGGF